MPFTIACPGCRTPYSVKDEQRGKSLRCVRCQTVFPAQPADAIQAPPAPPRAPVPSAPPLNREVAAAVQSSLPPAPLPGPELKTTADAPPAPPQPSGNTTAGKSAGVGAKLLAVVAFLGRQALSLMRWLTRRFLTLPRRAQLGVAAGGALGLMLLVGLLWAFSGSNSSPEGAVKDTRPEEKESPRNEPSKLAPLTGNEDLSLEAENKVKRATCQLVVRRGVDDAAEVATGSGFFVEDGVLVTNAHVLGMLDADTEPPTSIEVVLNSTEKDEKKIGGQVVGVDRDNDLAVVKVVGFYPKGTLPTPLNVKTTAELGTRHKLWVFGFPLPQQLGQGIVVTGATVSGLPKAADGSLRQILVTGNMQPGNSGGPVVDARGNVVGVAVAILVGTGFNFAVPGEQASTLLQGRIGAFTPGQPIIDKGRVVIPVSVARIDPVGKLREVAVDVWVGPPGEPRPATSATPPSQPGDSPHAKTVLAGRGDEATAEVILPQRTGNQVYWFQPRWVDGSNQAHWAGATPLPLKTPPIERKSADLVLKYATGTRPLTLSWKCSTSFNGKTERALTATLKNELSETVRGVDGVGTARVRWQYRSFDHDFTFDGETGQARLLKTVGPHIKAITADLGMDAEGKFTRQTSDSAKVPEGVRDLLMETHLDVYSTVRALSPPIPNRSTTPNESWSQTKLVLPLFTGFRFERSSLEMTYTYLGSRVHDGRNEALVALKGKIKGPWHSEDNIRGRLAGVAVLDLEAGQITQVDAQVNYTIEHNDDQLNGKIDLTLQRGLGR